MKRLERRLCAFNRGVYMKMDYREPKIIIPRISAFPSEIDSDGSFEARQKIIMNIYDDSDVSSIKDAVKNEGVNGDREYVYVLNHMLVDAYKRGAVEISDEAFNKEVDYRYASFVIRFGKKKKKKMDIDIFFDTKSMSCSIFVELDFKYMMKSNEWFMNKIIKGITRNADIFRDGDMYGRFKDEESAALLQIASNTLCNEACMPIIEFKF